jgi:hypothetical protein
MNLYRIISNHNLKSPQAWIARKIIPLNFIKTKLLINRIKRRINERRLNIDLNWKKETESVKTLKVYARHVRELFK